MTIQIPRSDLKASPFGERLWEDIQLRILSQGTDIPEIEGNLYGDPVLIRPRLGQGAFRVLVTDISMPGMSGVHLAEEIVARAPATAVVLVSGWAGSETSEALARLGASMVTKPFTTEAVRSAIASALARRSDHRG